MQYKKLTNKQKTPQNKQKTHQTQIFNATASSCRSAHQSEFSVLNSVSLLVVWRQLPEKAEGLEEKRSKQLNEAHTWCLRQQHHQLQPLHVADDFVLLHEDNLLLGSMTNKNKKRYYEKGNLNIHLF